MQKRLEWVDIAKGISIILVVIGHVGASYFGAELYKDSRLIVFVNQFIYSFHMAVFIFISGYLFSNSKNTNKGIRIKKLLLNYTIPYVTFSALWIVFKILLSSVTNTQVTFKELLLIVVFPVSFMWFIYALMIMEMIQILLPELSDRGKIINILIAGVFIVIQHGIGSQGIVVFGESFLVSDFVLSDVMKFYIYFLIGVYYGKKIVEFILGNKLKIILGGGTLLIAGNLVHFLKPEYYSLPMQIVLALSGIIVVIAISQSIGSMKKLEYLGRNTLPIYVLQGFCIAAVRLLNGKLHLNDALGIIPLIDCTVVSILVPLAIYELSKKVLKMDFFFNPSKYITIR